MTRVTVLAFLDRLSVFYSLAPLVQHAGPDVRFDVTTSLEHCLQEDENRHLVIVRYFSTMEAGSEQDRCLDRSMLARLRDRYDRITFFDDSDGAGTTRFEVLPYVDLYLKKQLLRDRSRYLDPMYGRQLYTDYYHRAHGVHDEEPLERVPAPDAASLAKVRLAYNLGVGSYPISPTEQRVGVALGRTLGIRPALLLHRDPRPVDVDAPRPLGVHAHFRVAGPATIRHQRRLFHERVQHDPRFLLGPVSSRAYRRELRRTQGTLSPFGWGEVCLRDFEAMLSGSVLLKPRMAHLDTWPDVFREGETYVPLGWDGRDVLAQTDAHLEEPRRREIAANAQDALLDARRQAPERVRDLVELMAA